MAYVSLRVKLLVSLCAVLVSQCKTHICSAFDIHCNIISDGPNMLRNALQNVLDDPSFRIKSQASHLSLFSI